MIEMEKQREKTPHEIEIDRINKERLEQFRCLKEKGNAPVTEPENDKPATTLLTGKL